MGFRSRLALAKSTLHPTVYNDPEAEGRIRSAIEASVIGGLTKILKNQGGAHEFLGRGLLLRQAKWVQLRPAVECKDARAVHLQE
jgi:hypothetical protein